MAAVNAKHGSDVTNAYAAVTLAGFPDGGYAQLPYAFNYYGPVGNQRDELVVVRRREAEVTY